MTDEPSDNGSIEIELVEHGGGRLEGDGSAGTRGDRDGRKGAWRPASESRRGQIFAIAVLAGVGGLVIGSILGGGGDRSAGPEITNAPTTVVVEENPVKVTLPEPAPVTNGGVDDVPPPTLPSLDSPSVEPGGAPLRRWWQELDVDDRFLGLPFEIAAVRRDGTLVRFNFLTGEQGFSIVSGGGADGVVAYRGGVLQLGSAESAFHSDSGGARRVRISDATTLFHAPGSGRVWAIDDALAAGLPGEVVELDGGGIPTQNVVDLPGPPIAIDRAGNWVVAVAGNTYSVTAAGEIVLLTSGSLVALGETVAIVKECDRFADCGYLTIERETGERTPSGISPSAALRIATRGESISPDGRFAITAASYRGSRDGENIATFDVATLVDLDRGTLDPRLLPWIDDPVLDVYWTPDSRFAFFVTQGAIAAFDTESHEMVDVTERSSSLPAELGFVGFDVRGTELVAATR